MGIAFLDRLATGTNNVAGGLKIRFTKFEMMNFPALTFKLLHPIKKPKHRLARQVMGTVRQIYHDLLPAQTTDLIQATRCCRSRGITTKPMTAGPR